MRARHPRVIFHGLGKALLRLGPDVGVPMCAEVELQGDEALQSRRAPRCAKGTRVQAAGMHQAELCDEVCARLESVHNSFPQSASPWLICVVQVTPRPNCSKSGLAPRNFVLPALRSPIFM